MKPPIRLLLVEDHPMFRAGLIATFQVEEHITLVGSAATAQGARPLITSQRPDVVVLDIGLPDANGILLIAHILREVPQCHILMLTTYEDDATVYSALRAGAHGYVIKSSNAEEIVRAVDTVASGAGHFSPGVMAQITQHIVSGGRSSDVSTFPELTRREREILDLLVDGHDNAYIADYFSLRLKTVRNYVSNIMTKAGASSRAEVIVQVRDAGLKSSKPRR